jgi:hypothetical protein
MPDASNAILYYEADRTAVDITELTNQGDDKDFRGSSQLWSGAAGHLPVVTPNGVYDGGIIIPAVSGDDDKVDISECRAYIAGVLTTISASIDEAITRPAAESYQKFSIQITAGGAFAVVEGVEHTGFSTVRGAAGGPPYVVVDSIELAQIWYDSQTPAVVTSDEIKQVIGTHTERWDYPQWQVNFANVANGALGYAGIEFYTALSAIHTGDVVKDVYASWKTPAFQEIVDAYDWVPPATTISVNTTEVYGRVKGGKTQSLGAGSFNMHLSDGVSDNILRHQNLNLWLKFFPNRLNAPYQLVQGNMVQQSQFPAGGNIMAAFSVAAESQGDNVFA